MEVIHTDYTAIALVITLLMLQATVVPAFQFAYDGSSRQNFTFQSTSDVDFSPNWAKDRLWLTPDPHTTLKSLVNNVAGRIRYTHPLPLFNPSTSQVLSFNISFSFTIISNGSYGYSGDGLAFSISPVLTMSAHSYGETFGVADTDTSDLVYSPDSHLFAVEFDNFQNDDLRDPSSSHIGIDLNGLASAATFDSRDFDSDLCLYNNYTIFAWVEYLAPLSLTRVYATNSSKRPSEPCVNVTHDLSTLFDPNQTIVYAAISASSGLAPQGAALFSWSFSSEDVPMSSPSPSPDQSGPESGLPFSQAPPTPPASGRNTVLPFILPPLAVLLVAISGLLFFCHKRKKQSSSLIQLMNSTGSVPRLSCWELRKATLKFHDTRKVGEGGYSSVYKGILSTGDVVAVKRLKQGLRMEEEFTSEIQIISRIRHRNLLQLRGWGYNSGEALLVYQYMPNGSLDSYLFGRKRSREEGLILDGAKRFRVLMGVAAGLEYLHGGLGECVLHRDVKAANVLLTESFEALLGDFGLARLVTHDQMITITAAGTPGYVAPEVVYTGRATDKADVYSFGILTLEVACGRRALDDSRPPEEMRLLDWVWQQQQNGKLMDVLDPVCCPLAPTHPKQRQQRTDDNGGGQMIAEEPQIAQTLDDGSEQMAKDLLQKWQCVLHLGLLCCDPFPEERLTMRQVHQSLRESLVLPLPSIRPLYRRPTPAVTTSRVDTTISSSAYSSTPTSSK